MECTVYGLYYLSLEIQSTGQHPHEPDRITYKVNCKALNVIGFKVLMTTHAEIEGVEKGNTLLIGRKMEGREEETKSERTNFYQ